MKNNLKKLILAGLFTIVCASGTAFANGLDNKNAIGMYIIGAETPIGGIQYERRFTDLFATKFGTYIYYSSPNNTDTPIECNFTVEPNFTLFETAWKDKVCSRLFAFGLLGYDYAKKNETHWDDTVYKRVVDSTKNQHSFIAGAGFGFDFTFFGHLSVPIQFGFMGNINGTDPNVGFCAGTAIRYSW